MSSGTVKVGDEYNWLTVERIYIFGGKTHFDVLCRCGNRCSTVARYVLTGKVKSCGCYRKTSEAYIASRRRKPFGYAALTQLFRSYQSNARRRRLNFSLTRDQFAVLTGSNCVYCGAVPFQINRLSKSAHGHYVYNGVDRKSNSEGYTPNNSVSCCGTCNRAKHTMSEKEFLSWVEKVSKFRSLG